MEAPAHVYNSVPLPHFLVPNHCPSLSTAMTSLYQRLKDGRQLLEVGVDDKNILVYNANPRINAIGTKGLNGCTCVVILGKSAIILAHISPYPGDFDSDTDEDLPQKSYQHHEDSLTAVTDLMKSHIRHFPASTTAWGIFADDQAAGSVTSIIDQVRDRLRAVSLEMRSAFYKEADVSGILPPKGELVSFFKDSKAQLVMEKTQLWPQTKSSSAGPSLSGSSTAAGSSTAGSSNPRSSTQATTSAATPSTGPPQTWAGYPLRQNKEGATLLSFKMSGKIWELPAFWQQGKTLPMIWSRNSWVQTGWSQSDEVLLMPSPNGPLVLDKPTA